jgi:hypothetical protein
MSVGACLITTGEAPERPRLGEIAPLSERAEASWVWFNDRLLGEEVTSAYPDSAAGRAPWDSDLAHHQQPTSPTFAAAPNWADPDARERQRREMAGPFTSAPTSR